jgi:hypothetical protein
MSVPSFKLAKVKGIWWATSDVGWKNPVRVECGDGSEAAARKIAEIVLKRRAQLAAAGKQRWANTRARDKAVADELAAARAARRATPAPPKPEEHEPLSAEVNPPPAPDPEPTPSPAAPGRAEEIQAKLRALGDGRPIVPDAIHPPGEDPTDADPNDPPLDNEAGELIAELFADGLVAGHVKFVASRLKKLKPPKRPGEPNERMQGWYRDGVAYNAAKLVGKATTMGPTGKMLVGAVLMTAGMLLDAELLEGAPAAAAAAAPSPTPARAPAAADVVDEPADHQPTTQLTALGRFR